MKKKKIKYVYVSSPISDTESYGSYTNNVRANIFAATELLALGYVPFAPAQSVLWDCITVLPYETWIAYDKAWIDRCDAVLRLKGKSSGADREVRYAKKHGLPVFYSIEELIKYEKE